jgi:hypothetical protein
MKTRLTAIKGLMCAAAFVIGAAFPMSAHADFCWKDSYGRGAGTVPDHCKDPNRAMDEGLCYNKCDGGWDGKATICYQNCPSGYRDDGLFCAKQGEYGRGAGYAIWDEGKCKKEHSQGCEKNGALWYPKCKSGFKAVGCCICSPVCPAGWTDIGVSCTKPSKNRGAGLVPDQCKADKQMDAGLCYNKCRDKFDGVGPVCWGQCTGATPVNCGAGCAGSQSECAQQVTEQVVTVLDVVATAVSTAATLGGATAAKAAVSTAVKTGVKTAVDKAAKKGVSAATKAAAKESIRKLAKDAGKTLTENQIEQLALASTGEEFDYTSLDPSGIASLVKAYNHPICK